jgi:CrcB protein
MTFSRVAAVFLGGGLGACARFLLLQVLSPWSTRLPLPVLLVNVIGSFLLGVVFVLADEADLMRSTTRLFLAVGVLGGFTTFSTLGWGADTLIGGGHTFTALIYIVASLIGGMIAVAGGVETGREIVRGAPRLARGALAGRYSPRNASPPEDMTSIETDNRDDGELA